MDPGADPLPHQPGTAPAASLVVAVVWWPATPAGFLGGLAGTWILTGVLMVLVGPFPAAEGDRVMDNMLPGANVLRMAEEGSTAKRRLLGPGPRGAGAGDARRSALPGPEGAALVLALTDAIGFSRAQAGVSGSRARGVSGSGRRPRRVRGGPGDGRRPVRRAGWPGLRRRGPSAG